MTITHRFASTTVTVNPPKMVSIKSQQVLPGVWVFGEGGQTAGVHVPAHVNVDWSVGFSQLSRQWDSLSGQRRHWRPGHRQPRHAPSLLYKQHSIK